MAQLHSLSVKLEQTWRRHAAYGHRQQHSSCYAARSWCPPGGRNAAAFTVNSASVAAWAPCSARCLAGRISGRRMCRCSSSCCPVPYRADQRGRHSLARQGRRPCTARHLDQHRAHAAQKHPQQRRLRAAGRSGQPAQQVAPLNASRCSSGGQRLARRLADRLRGRVADAPLGGDRIDLLAQRGYRAQHHHAILRADGGRNRGRREKQART